MSLITTTTDTLSMENTDQHRFAEIMDGIQEYYKTSQPRLQLGANSLKLYFQSLCEYSLDQVSHAFYAHIKSPGGRFFPAVADIERIINGPEITIDYVIASARLAETPFGVLCKMRIGTWDLQHHNGQYLRQRAAECLQLLPEWRAKAKKGEYSDAELRSFVRHNISPTMPFLAGTPPGKSNQQTLKHFQMIVDENQDETKRLTAIENKKPAAQKNSQSVINDLLKTLSVKDSHGQDY